MMCLKYCLKMKSDRMIISTISSLVSHGPSGKPSIPKKYQAVIKLYVKDPRIILLHKSAKDPDSLLE